MSGNALRFFLFSSLMGILFWTCSPEEISLEDYYYPFDDLLDGQVYEYRPVDNDSIFPDYWYLRTLKDDAGKDFLVSQLYGPLFNVKITSTEEYQEEGSVMTDYRLFETNPEGKSLTIKPSIEANEVYPFWEGDEDSFSRMKLVWNEIREPEMQTTMTRGRKFQEIKTITYQGKEIECALFGSTQLVEFDHPEEGHREYEIQNYETFAKDIGLIHYRKEVLDGPVIEYELVRRFPMTELEAIFKAAQE